MEKLLSPAKAADVLGVSVETLGKWRRTGRGPAFIKASEGRQGRIGYWPSDIAAWQQAKRNAPDDRRLLRPKEAAHLIGVHVKTLEVWRRTGRGPTFIKTADTVRAPIRYSEEDILAWQNRKEEKVQHDRDYWRSCSTARLIEEGKSNPTTELCIALAERLEDAAEGESE